MAQRAILALSKIHPSIVTTYSKPIPAVERVRAAVNQHPVVVLGMKVIFAFVAYHYNVWTINNCMVANGMVWYGMI
jgi:hypothetical protein